MSLVVFSHTKTREEEYLHQLFEEKGWFERKSFSIFLPKNKDTIESEIRTIKELLREKIIWLKKEWEDIEKDYFQIVSTFKRREILSSYKCHVSRFGPEGKYHRPDLLFVRLRTKRDERRIIETVGHELLHLTFADFFKLKKLNYSEREGMVDALILQSDLARIFPNYEKQSIGILRPKLLKSIKMEV